MKILKLEAENVKRLRAVEIEPDGATVVISGRNGQGKTSVLDSIWFALGGGPAARETPRPVRDGEDHAHVRLDLGDIIVTRTWTGAKTKLTVDSKEGARFSSPQAMLDDLVGRLSFDPLGFSQLPDREQRATLLGLIDLPFEPGKLEAERRGVFEQRTEVNREALRLEGVLSGLEEPPEDLPEEEVSTVEILGEYEAAQATIRANNDLRADAHRCQQDVDLAETTITHLRDQLASAETGLQMAETRLAEASAALTGLVDPDVSGYAERLAEVETTNDLIRHARHRSKIASDLFGVHAASASLTAKLDEIETRKTTAIRDATMPVPGLSFDEEGVLFDGIPFKQASSAEQLRVSVAMAIALNPTIRVIRITDGSLLDSDSMRLVTELAEEHDAQVWIEVVDETGTVGIVIEDGAIIAPELAEVEA